MGAESRLDYRKEAESFDTSNYLSELGIGELTGNRRSNYSISLIFRIADTALNHIDYLQNIRLIGYRAEGTLIYARSAGYTFIVVYMRRLGLVHTYCLDLAGALAGTNIIVYRAVRANLGAHTALDAFALVNVRYVIVVEGDSSALAHVLATVSKTAAARACYLVTAHRTLVAGYIYNLNDVLVARVTAHSDFYTLAENGAFLINAAAHSRLSAGNNGFRDVEGSLGKSARPSLARDLAQNLIFEILYLCIKLFHSTPLEIADLDSLAHLL